MLPVCRLENRDLGLVTGSGQLQIHQSRGRVRKLKGRHRSRKGGSLRENGSFRGVRPVDTQDGLGVGNRQRGRRKRWPAAARPEAATDKSELMRARLRCGR